MKMALFHISSAEKESHLALENILRKQRGIDKVDFDVTVGEVKVYYDQELTGIEGLKRAILDAGYLLE